MARFTQALRSGFEIGTATGGGRFSGVGQVIKGIADKLQRTRETEEELGVLGRTERVKARIKQEFEPKFQPIVGETGEVIGQRPKGSVFAPRETAFQRQLLGGIRQLKAENSSLEEIRQFISFSGANPEDFADEIGGFQPTPKKSFLKGFAKDVFSKGIGQLFGR